MARDPPSPESPVSPIRGTVRIPRDQAALLDKSDSWISKLKASNNPLGLVNLPTNVFSSLTDFHRKRLQHRLVPTETEGSRKGEVEEEPGVPQENAVGKDSAAPCTTQEAGATDPSTPTKERALAVNHSADDSNQQPESSPGTSISWSPSPDRDLGKSVEHRSFPDVLQARAQPQLPSSSSELEEELEVVAPRGMRDPAGPTNLGEARHLSPSPTPGYTSSPPPPCGQGDRHLIHADFDEEPEKDMQADSESTNNARDVPGRRSRRMQGPVFPSITLQQTSHLGNRHATAKVQPSPRFSMLDSSQASLSSVGTQTSPVGDNPTSPWEASGPGKRQNPHASSPDLIDETPSKRLRALCSDAMHEDSPRRKILPSPSIKDTQQSPADDRPTSTGEALEPHQQVSQIPNWDPNQESSSMKPRTSHRDADLEGPAGQEILVPATPVERYPDLVMSGRTAHSVRYPKPFDTYKEAYPRYHGTLTDFIDACISLEYFQRQDLMRDLLYDDFIHAWVEGYIGYVAKYGDAALPANQWFNRLGGRVECDNMVITRKNLHLVPEAYPKEYREVLRALQLDQSPERPTTSRMTEQTVRPGSAQEAIPHFRQATTTPKGRLDQNALATLPQARRVAPEVQIRRAGIPASQHPRTTHGGNGQVSASSQAPLIIPATQSPSPTALNQRSPSGSIQGSYHHPNGKRSVYPQTPYSVIAESPFKRVATSKEQLRQSIAPPSHPFNEATLQQALVSEETESPLSMSKITSPSVIPVAIQDNSNTEDLTPTGATAQALDEAGITPMRSGDDRFLLWGTRDAGDSSGGLTSHDVTSPDRPFPNTRCEGSKTEFAGTSDSLFERRVRSPDLHSPATSDSSFERSRARSPDLHSSAYVSPSLPRKNDSDPDGGSRNAGLGPVEVQQTEISPSSKTREHETRGFRHSVATGNPRASSRNDKIKKVMDGRVQKETGRKSLGSKGGQEESDKKSGGKKKKKKKKRRVTMEEALQEFVLKRWAEKAAVPPASGQSPASGH